MLFNPRSITWVALATLMASLHLVDALPSFDPSSVTNLKARHNSLHRRFDAVSAEKGEVGAAASPQEQAVEVKQHHKRNNSRKCPAKKTSSSSQGSQPPVNNVETAPPPPPSQSQSRLDKITSMYAFEGFVYALSSCKGKSGIASDFKSMAAHNARRVITFGSCPSQDSTNDYENVIQAAADAGLEIILLVDTLITDSDTLYGNVIPRSSRIAQAIINKPDNVLALALGDETLYDGDFNSPGNLASHIYDLKGQFKSAGIEVPISISDLAFGWQSASQTSSSSSVADAVDFMMINTFPYFGQSASWGGNNNAWDAFTKDISFFEKIANGKPLLVTQTGWPSNKDEFAPNSGSIVASVSSSEAYWNLLNSHCSDFFKAKNIGWMWRDWDDAIEGWGVKDSSGNFKFSIDGAKRTC